MVIQPQLLTAARRFWRNVKLSLKQFPDYQTPSDRARRIIRHACALEAFGFRFGIFLQPLEGIALGPPGACHNIFSAYEIERRPRGASRVNPLPQVCFGPVTPVRSPLSALFVPFDNCGGAVAFHLASAMHQGGQHNWHRTDWPETNCGSGFTREAPRGRRSISASPQNSRQALQSPQQPPARRQNPHSNPNLSPLSASCHAADRFTAL
jgi:hypothetical protein